MPPKQAGPGTQDVPPIPQGPGTTLDERHKSLFTHCYLLNLANSLPSHAFLHTGLSLGVAFRDLPASLPATFDIKSRTKQVFLKVQKEPRYTVYSLSALVLPLLFFFVRVHSSFGTSSFFSSNLSSDPQTGQTRPALYANQMHVA